jgi:hypothetical protein
MPSLSVLVERLKPVASFVIVTFAPGTTALLASVTLPEMVAVVSCAKVTPVRDARAREVTHIA